MSEFTEADARLGAMHGYDVARERARPEEQQQRAGAQYETAAGRNAQVTGSVVLTPGLPRAAPTSVRKSDVVEIQQHLERLEAKVDALIVALRSGAVGKWTP